MAFLPAIPWLSTALAAGGAAYQGIKQSQAETYNAKVMGQEQANTVNQANAQEGLVRRNSREMLGRQSAAFGAANVGYGGSSETALDQSAVNQELDALNTRYKGAITGWGYGAQSQLDQQQAQESLVNGGLLAGAALLKQTTSNYTTFKPPGAAEQAGLVSPNPASGLGG
jgi:hypothetical protein